MWNCITKTWLIRWAEELITWSQVAECLSHWPKPRRDFTPWPDYDAYDVTDGTAVLSLCLMISLPVDVCLSRVLELCGAVWALNYSWLVFAATEDTVRLRVWPWSIMFHIYCHFKNCNLFVFRILLSTSLGKKETNLCSMSSWVISLISWSTSAIVLGSTLSIRSVWVQKRVVALGCILDVILYARSLVSLKY